MPDIDIKSGLAAVLASNQRRWPCHVNRVSALDDPCLRKLYYMRAAWDKATPIDTGLAGVFATGNILEPVIERIVSEVGAATDPIWRIVGTQTPANDALLKEYQISGTIDGFLQVEERGLFSTIGVVDIKTMSPNIYPRINCYANLSRYPWTRRYRGQLMLYALAHNQERCWLLLVNKGNLYDMKLVGFDVDMGYCDELLAKAKAVNEAIAKGDPPDGVNDPNVCDRCAWLSYCAPDISTGGDLEIMDNPELEVILDRLGELQPTAKEFKDLETQRDSLLAKGKNIACGRWLVTWKKVIVHYKLKPASPAREVEQWRKTIRRE